MMRMRTAGGADDSRRRRWTPIRLALGLAPPLEKNVEFLNDCLDDVQVGFT